MNLFGERKQKIRVTGTVSSPLTNTTAKAWLLCKKKWSTLSALKKKVSDEKESTQFIRGHSGFSTLEKQARKTNIRGVRIKETKHRKWAAQRGCNVFCSLFRSLSDSMLRSPTQVDPQSDSVLNFNHNLSYTVARSYIQPESPHHTNHLP